MNKTCATCDYYAKFEGVCCDADSEHRADFRRPEDGCPNWGNYDYEFWGEEPNDD